MIWAIEEILGRYKMERVDLYEDDRVLRIVEGELQDFKNGRIRLGEVLDNLQWILEERAHVQEEQ